MPDKICGVNYVRKGLDLGLLLSPLRLFQVLLLLLVFLEHSTFSTKRNPSCLSTVHFTLQVLFV